MQICPTAQNLDSLQLILLDATIHMEGGKTTLDIFNAEKLPVIVEEGNLMGKEEK